MGDICELQNGRAFKQDEWLEAGHPIIRIQNLSDPNKGFNYAADGYPKKFWVDRGDILFSWSGTPGTSFGCFRWNGPAGWLNQHIFKIKFPKPEEVDAGYFVGAVNGVMKEIIAQAHGGVGLKHITKSKLLDVEIALPDLEEQKRIAKILDAADALRAKRRESLAQLDALLQSTFIEMFGDPIKNERGYERFPLKSLGTVVTGRTPSSKLSNMYGGDVPFVTPGDLNEGWLDVSARRLTTEGVSRSKSVDPGALLVCCIGATIGKMGKARLRSAFNQQINAVDWGERVLPNFGLELMKFFKETIASEGASTTLPILKKSLFEKIAVPIPPISEQRVFSKIVERLEEQQTNLSAHLGELNLLFYSLQQRAFSGEL